MKDVIESLVESIPNWRQSLNKQRQIQKSQRKWKEREYIPTPEEMKEMKTCKHARSCQKYLLKRPANLEEAVDSRNYVMFLISTQNANRAGLLSNMTIGDVRDNQRIERAKRVIHIASHKTVTSYGGKCRILSPQLI